MNNTTDMKLELSAIRMKRINDEGKLLIEMAGDSWNLDLYDIIKDNWETDEDTRKYLIL